MNMDVGYAVINTLDGGYLIAGIANSSKAWLIKTDKDGNIVWSKSFYTESSSYSIFNDVTVSDNEYIAVGAIIVNWSALIVKYDDNGNQVWARIFDNASRSMLYSIVAAREGGYIATGYLKLNDSQSYDILLMKINDDGYVIWKKTYGGSGIDQGYVVIPAIDYSYIILGVTSSPETRCTWLIKVDEDGDIEWNKTYEGEGLSIIQSHDNGYIITGITSYSDLKPDVLLIKVDEDGNIIWNKTYRVTDFNRGIALIKVIGGYLILGEIGSNPYENKDVLLIKVDEDGNIIWNKTYGGPGEDIGYSIALATDGGYVIVGETSSYGADGIDVLLMKVSDNGSLEWVRLYSGKKVSRIASLILDACFNMINNYVIPITRDNKSESIIIKNL